MQDNKRSVQLLNGKTAEILSAEGFADDDRWSCKATFRVDTDVFTMNRSGSVDGRIPNTRTVQMIGKWGEEYSDYGKMDFIGNPLSFSKSLASFIKDAYEDYERSGIEPHNSGTSTSSPVIDNSIPSSGAESAAQMYMSGNPSTFEEELETEISENGYDNEDGRVLGKDSELDREPDAHNYTDIVQNRTYSNGYAGDDVDNFKEEFENEEFFEEEVDPKKEAAKEKREKRRAAEKARRERKRRIEAERRYNSSSAEPTKSIEEYHEGHSSDYSSEYKREKLSSEGSETHKYSSEKPISESHKSETSSSSETYKEPATSSTLSSSSEERYRDSHYEASAYHEEKSVSSETAPEKSSVSSSISETSKSEPYSAPISETRAEEHKSSEVFSSQASENKSESSSSKASDTPKPSPEPASVSSASSGGVTASSVSSINGSTGPTASVSSSNSGYKPVASGQAIFEGNPYDKNQERAKKYKTEQVNREKETMLANKIEEKKKDEDAHKPKMFERDKKEPPKANIRANEHGFQTSTDNHTSHTTVFVNTPGSGESPSGVRLLSQYATNSLGRKIASKAPDPLSRLTLSAGLGVAASKLSLHFKNASLAMSKDFRESVSIINDTLGKADVSYGWKTNYKNALLLADATKGKGYYNNFTVKDLNKESELIGKQIDDLVNSIKKMQDKIDNAKNKEKELLKRNLADLEEQMARKKTDMAITKALATGRKIENNKKMSGARAIQSSIKSAFYSAAYSDEYFAMAMAPVRVVRNTYRTLEKVVDFKYNLNKSRIYLSEMQMANNARKGAKIVKKAAKTKDSIARLEKLSKAKNLSVFKRSSIDGKLLRRQRRLQKLERANGKLKSKNLLLSKNQLGLIEKLSHSKLGMILGKLSNIFAWLKTLLLKVLGYVAIAYLIILGVVLGIYMFLVLVNYQPGVEGPLDTEIGTAWQACKLYESRWLGNQTLIVNKINEDDNEKMGNKGILSKAKWGFKQEKFPSYMASVVDNTVRDNAAFKFRGKDGNNRLKGTLYFKAENESRYDSEILLDGYGHGDGEGEYAYAGRTPEESPSDGCYPVTIDVYSFDVEFIKAPGDAYAADGAIWAKNGRLSNIKEILAMCLTYYDNESGVEQEQPGSGIFPALDKAVAWIENIKDMLKNFVKGVIGWIVDEIESKFEIDIPEILTDWDKAKVAAVYTTFSLVSWKLSHEGYLVSTSHDKLSPDLRYCGIAGRQTFANKKSWKGHLDTGHDEAEIPGVEETDEGESGTISTITEAYAESSKFAGEAKLEECSDQLEFTYKFGQAKYIWTKLDGEYAFNGDKWGRFWTDSVLCTCPESDKQHWIEQMEAGELDSWEDTECAKNGGHTYKFCPGHLVCKCCITVKTFLSTQTETLFEMLQNSWQDELFTGIVEIVVKQVPPMPHFNYLFKEDFSHEPKDGWTTKEMQKKVSINYKDDWNDSMFAQFKIPSKYYIGHSLEGMDRTAIPERQRYVNKFIEKKYEGKDLSPKRITVLQIASAASGNIPYSYGGSSSQVDFYETNFFPDGLDCSGFACWVFSNTIAPGKTALVGPPGQRSSCSGILGCNPSHGLAPMDPTLKPGDLVIKNAAAGGATTSSNHVKIFVGWNDDGTAVTIECGGRSAGHSTVEWSNGSNGIYEEMLNNLTGELDAGSHSEWFKFKKHKSFCILNIKDDLSSYKYAVIPACYEGE